VYQLEAEFSIGHFSPVSLLYFNNVTVSVLKASACCDRDVQGSLDLLSVQLVFDSKSCFHSPSEDL